MELTLFELHLDDASFTANAPFTGTSDEESMDVEASEEDEEGGGPPAIAFVVGLVFLVGVGLAIRRLLGGKSEPMDEEATTEPITA